MMPAINCYIYNQLRIELWRSLRVEKSNPEVQTLFREIMRQCQRERKAKSDLTIRNLSSRLDKTENYLSSIENGREFPSLKTFLHYLLVLGFDVQPLTKLAIDSEQLESAGAQRRSELIEKVDSLDDDQVDFLLEQSRLADTYRVKGKRK